MNGVELARESHDRSSLVLEPPPLIGAWAGIQFLRRAGSKRLCGAFKLVLFSGAAIVQWKRWQRVP